MNDYTSVTLQSEDTPKYTPHGTANTFHHCCQTIYITDCPNENLRTHGKFNGRCMSHTPPVLSRRVRYTASRLLSYPVPFNLLSVTCVKHSVAYVYCVREQAEQFDPQAFIM